jgi:hypothetical protein
MTRSRKSMNDTFAKINDSTVAATSIRPPAFSEWKNAVKRFVGFIGDWWLVFGGWIDSGDDQTSIVVSDFELNLPSERSAQPLAAKKPATNLFHYRLFPIRPNRYDLNWHFAFAFNECNVIG